MTAIIIILVLCIAFYSYVYSNWKHKGKMAFKIVMECFSVCFTVFLLIFAIFSGSEVFDMMKDKSLQGRVEQIDWEMSRGDFEYTRYYLIKDKDFEKDFDYAWEQLNIYDSANYYLIFNAAREENLGDRYTQNAELFEDRVKKACQNVACDVNIPYAKRILMKCGLSD